MDSKNSITYYVDGEDICIKCNIIDFEDFILLASSLLDGDLVDKSSDCLKLKLKESGANQDEIKIFEDFILNKTPVISPINYK